MRVQTAQRPELDLAHSALRQLTWAPAAIRVVLVTPGGVLLGDSRFPRLQFFMSFLYESPQERIAGRLLVDLQGPSPVRAPARPR